MKRHRQWLHGRGCGGALFWLHGVSTGREPVLIAHSGCPAHALAGHTLAHGNGPCSLVAHSVWPTAGYWHKSIPRAPSSWAPQRPSSPEAKGRYIRQAMYIYPTDELTQWVPTALWPPVGAPDPAISINHQLHLLPFCVAVSTSPPGPLQASPPFLLYSYSTKVVVHRKLMNPYQYSKNVSFWSHQLNCMITKSQLCSLSCLCC